MPVYSYECPKCGYEDEITRKTPPTHCPDCGAELVKVVEKKVPPTPPTEQELEEKEEAAVVDDGTPKQPKGQHRKRRKVVRLLKFILGKDLTELVSNSETWKDVARSKAEKAMDIAGFDKEEKEDWLEELDEKVERLHQKARQKLK